MKPSSRYTIVFVSICCLLLPKKITRACGWFVWPGEYRFWLMQPDLANMDDLSPFFVAVTYPDDDRLRASTTSNYDVNIEEWYDAINGAATKADTRKILYDTKPGEMMENLPELKKNNSFVRALSKKGNEELFQYLLLSKKTEAVATVPDAWQERPAQDPLIARVLETADSLYNNSRSSFVKLRTAYQMMRLYKYYGAANRAEKIYDSLIAPIDSKSWIKPAALYEKAIVMPGWNGDYLLSKVFDKGYNRSFCVSRFASDSLQKILPFARNDHERVVLYTMQTLNHSGRSLNRIEQIYRLEPSYRDLPFLLLREINKIEDWLVTRQVTDYETALRGYFYYEYGPAYNYAQDQAYARQLYQLIVKMIGEKKAANPPVLDLMACHLMLILKDYAAAAQHLEAAKQFPSLLPNVTVQIKINELMLYTLTHDHFDNKAQEMFLKLADVPDEQLPVQKAALLKDKLTLFIGKKLMDRGELVAGTMILARTNRTWGDLNPVISNKHVYIELQERAGPSHYDSMIAILDKKIKTPFEKYLGRGPFVAPVDYYRFYEWETGLDTGWSRSRLLDCKASWYIRQDSLQQALTTMQQIPDSFYRQAHFVAYINGDPFSVDVDHGHHTDRYEAICGKVEVVKEMIRLQNIAKKDSSKAALCYLQLGNAHFNMTWHGKNWLMVKEYWSMHHFDTDLKRTPFNDHYFGCERARAYYLKALKLSKDKKLASLATFLAGNCREKFQQYISLTQGKYSNHRFTNTYISLLKKSGFNTEYYDEMVKECATYELFRQEARRMQP